MKVIINQIKKVFSIITNTVLLTVVYFIGVGLTAFFARLLRKSFLFGKNKRNSSFVVFKKADSLERMF